MQRLIELRGLFRAHTAPDGDELFRDLRQGINENALVDLFNLVSPPLVVRLEC